VSGELIASLPGGHVLFSTRAEGNMSSVGGEGAELGASNRERLRAELGLDSIARGFQVHGIVVDRVTAARSAEPAPEQLPRAEAPPAELPRADGQATAMTGVGVMVLAADCLPVALGAPGAVAIVHAGWRGLAAGVLESGVTAIRELAGDTGPIEAVIGPGAGPCCYEVGPAVAAALGQAVSARTLIDLRAIARARLHAAGVASISELGGCTICDQRFFSHRREGPAAGRNLGVAWRS
jgi:YfiH family protein